MKFFNFYSGTALALIASLVGSLGAATGEMAPPLIVGALLFTLLVLGWAGGASDARAELDRLARLESGRQLLAQSHIKQRDLLEEALERLQHRIEEVTASNAGLRNVAEREAAEVERLLALVKDCQESIELFTINYSTSMVRITALEGENAELRKRPSAEVLRATAYRLSGEALRPPDEEATPEEAADDLMFLNGTARGLVMMLSALLREMETPQRVAEHTNDLAVESK